MRFQKQKNRHFPEKGIWGDCYRTVLACLLDLDRDSVPHFYDKGEYEKGQKQAKEFLKERGLIEVYVDITAEKPEDALELMGSNYPDLVYMFTGLSKTNVNHVVIARGGEIIFDPSINDSGIIGPMKGGENKFSVSFLVPILQETKEASPPLNPK